MSGSDALARERESAQDLLGWPGRMISASKTGYRRAHPDNAAIFNGNVCLAAGKIWHGDLDLTLDEQHLLDLAAQLGQTVFVLYEQDGRFEHEREPLLDHAVYRAFPDGQTCFDQRRFHRDKEQKLRHIQPPQRRHPYIVTPWDWDGSRRWRLWRFWRVELVRNSDRAQRRQINRLLYVGVRGIGKRSPLLVLGVFRTLRPNRATTVELTWYPSRRPHLSEPRPKLHRRLHLGRIEIGVYLLRWPGFTYEARLWFGQAGRQR